MKPGLTLELMNLSSKAGTKASKTNLNSIPADISNFCILLFLGGIDAARGLACSNKYWREKVYYVFTHTSIFIKTDILTKPIFAPNETKLDFYHQRFVKVIQGLNDLIEEGKDELTPALMTGLRNLAAMGAVPAWKIICSRFLSLLPQILQPFESNKIEEVTSAAVHSGSLELVKYLSEQKASFRINNSYTKTELHIAAQEGHLNIVEFLTTQYNARESFFFNAQSRESGEIGATALMLAARHGHPNVVKSLLAAKVDTTKKDSSRQNAFHYCLAGNTSLENKILIFEYLFHAVAPDLEEKNVYGETLTLTALKYGAPLDIVQALVNLGSSQGISVLATETENGNTAFEMIAASTAYPREKDQLDTLKYLLGIIGNLFEQSTQWTRPLQAAIPTKKLTVIEFFLEKQLERTQTTGVISNEFIFVLERLALSDQIQFFKKIFVALKKKPALLLKFAHGLWFSAIKSDNPELVTLFLDQEESLLKSTHDGTTPVYLAAQSGHKVLKLFIERGYTEYQMADGTRWINSITTVDSITAPGLSPLFCAVIWRKAKAVELLVEAKADINLIRNKETLLHCSLQPSIKSTEIFLYLYPLISTTIRNEYCKNLLIFAAGYAASLPIFQRLFEEKIEWLQVNSAGENVFHLLAKNEQVTLNVLNFLYEKMDRKAIEAVDNNSNTPLHHAIRILNIVAIQFFLATGINIFTNLREEDLFEVLIPKIQKENHPEIFRLLISHLNNLAITHPEPTIRQRAQKTLNRAAFKLLESKKEFYLTNFELLMETETLIITACEEKGGPTLLETAYKIGISWSYHAALAKQFHLLPKKILDAELRKFFSSFYGHAVFAENLPNVRVILSDFFKAGGDITNYHKTAINLRTREFLPDVLRLLGPRYSEVDPLLESYLKKYLTTCYINPNTKNNILFFLDAIIYPSKEYLMSIFINNQEIFEDKTLKKTIQKKLQQLDNREFLLKAIKEKMLDVETLYLEKNTRSSSSMDKIKQALTETKSEPDKSSSVKTRFINLWNYISNKQHDDKISKEKLAKRNIIFALLTVHASYPNGVDTKTKIDVMDILKIGIDLTNGMEGKKYASLLSTFFEVPYFKTRSERMIEIKAGFQEFIKWLQTKPTVLAQLNEIVQRICPKFKPIVATPLALEPMPAVQPPLLNPASVTNPPAMQPATSESYITHKSINSFTGIS